MLFSSGKVYRNRVVALSQDPSYTCRLSGDAGEGGWRLEFLIHRPKEDRAVVAGSPYAHLKLNSLFCRRFWFPLRLLDQRPDHAEQVLRFAAFGVEWSVELENDAEGSCWLKLRVLCEEGDSLVSETQPCFNLVLTYPPSNSLADPPFRVCQEQVYFGQRQHAVRLMDCTAKREWVKKNQQAITFSCVLSMQVAKLHSPKSELRRLDRERRLLHTKLQKDEATTVQRILSLARNPCESLQKKTRLLLELGPRLQEIKRALQAHAESKTACAAERSFDYYKLVLNTGELTERTESEAMAWPAGPTPSGGAGTLFANRGVVILPSDHPLPWDPDVAVTLRGKRGKASANILRQLGDEVLDSRGAFCKLFATASGLKTNSWFSCSDKPEARPAFGVQHGDEVSQPYPTNQLKLRVMKREEGSSDRDQGGGFCAKEEFLLNLLLDSKKGPVQTLIAELEEAGTDQGTPKCTHQQGPTACSLSSISFFEAEISKSKLISRLREQ